MRQSIWTVQEPLTGHFNVQPVIVLLGLAALVLLLLYKMIDTLQLRMKPRTVFTYIPLSEATKKAEGTVVLVDCSAIGNHPTLTHHKSNCNPKKEGRQGHNSGHEHRDCTGFDQGWLLLWR
mmetsp:Transcript_6483/g.17351  ORF Transcript_6483/g.17351 Transcript_6483/m.17351 type:complete len:121 (+) Transcript_6483:94-456(+)